MGLVAVSCVSNYQSRHLRFVVSGSHTRKTSCEQDSSKKPSRHCYGRWYLVNFAEITKA
jgi:hypothetical protein